MKEFWGVIGTILVIAILLMIDKVIKYYHQRRLFKLISWSVIGDYNPAVGRGSYISELIYEIERAQYNNSIDAQYRITEKEEKQFLVAIIEEYQKEVSRRFFREQLNVPRSKPPINEIDYFMGMLHDFLTEHDADRCFAGYEMYGSIADPEDCSFNHVKYNMSDFGILYYKLYYITIMYCKNSVAYQGKVAEWAEKNTKEVLDKKQIEIFRYRP